MNILKKIWLKYSERRINLVPSISVSKKWYGNDYGGFYVLPELLDRNSIIYSMGIGEDVSFDLDIIMHHDAIVFGFDPTPKSIDWVASANLPPGFRFLPYGIAKQTGNVEFFLPKNVDHVSGSLVANSHVNTERKIRVPMKSISDIMSELKHAKIDVLKMDIEGAEYDVLPAILEANVEIIQLIVEFHHRLIGNSGRKKTKKIIRLIRQKGYKIFGVSTSGNEVSFINSAALQS